jgi:hypothetical protein
MAMAMATRLTVMATQPIRTAMATRPTLTAMPTQRINMATTAGTVLGFMHVELPDESRFIVPVGIDMLTAEREDAGQARAPENVARADAHGILTTTHESPCLEMLFMTELSKRNSSAEINFIRIVGVIAVLDNLPRPRPLPRGVDLTNFATHLGCLWWRATRRKMTGGLL